jgi:adenosylmethionine-8-amino-7-oxononanoate aminotransferase
VETQHRQFAAQLKSTPKIKNVRIQGTIIAFEIITDTEDSYINNLADYLHRFFRERRIMLRPLGTTLYIMAPYCITNEQLDTVYKSIADCVEAL